VSEALANFLFEAANFVVLAGALTWLLFKPVRAALDAERDRHAAAEQEATRLRTEAETLRDEAHAAQVALAKQVEQQAVQAEIAAREAAAKLAEATAHAEQEHRDRLTHTAEVAARQQAEALAGTIGEIAGAAVSNMLATLDGPSLDEALIRRLDLELGQLGPPRRGAVVESARPLSPASTALLRERLGEFQARVVPSLGAGARATTPAGQVDASAQGLARVAARELLHAAQDDNAEGS
jgi:F-type H+-transporting ATPase subunit b